MPVTYIVCPAGLVTGGPELLHQLAATLNANGREAYMVYYPFKVAHATPPAYVKYSAPIARFADILPGDNVVLPEVYTTLAKKFSPNQLFLWWLSVDNFRLGLASARASQVTPSLFRPLGRTLLARSTIARRLLHQLGKYGGTDDLASVDVHLHQSDFARQYLQENGFGPTAALGDYINETYLELIAAPPTVPRENLIAFNPLKGAERTEAIFAELAARGIDAQPAPIKGYTREGVRDLLSRAKLYMDFGNHPGKDRIPREAAAAGACVIVNRRGSAANPIDVPLPDEYKVDDEADGFAAEAADKISAVLENFQLHSIRFATYRARIAAEPGEFVRQTLALFA